MFKAVVKILMRLTKAFALGIRVTSGLQILKLLLAGPDCCTSNWKRTEKASSVVLGAFIVLRD